MKQYHLMDVLDKAKFAEEYRRKERELVQSECGHAIEFIEWSEDLQKYLCTICGFRGEIKE